MSFHQDNSLRKLRSSGRYLLFTGLGSALLLSSFSWSAETSFVWAAGLGVLLELLIENAAKSRRPQPPKDADFGGEATVSAQFKSAQFKRGHAKDPI